MLPKFFGGKIPVFIEGNDDILFWKYHFQTESVKIQTVDGVEALQSYIAKIVKEDAKIIVAMDSDYSLLLEKRLQHPRVLYTYGYSIENTIYCSVSINRMVSNYCKKELDLVLDIDLWFEKFANSIYDLVCYDASSILYAKSLKVLGDNSAIIMDSKHDEIDKNKINSIISFCQEKITREEFESVNSLIAHYPHPVRFLVRGHFYLFALHKYIKRKCKEISGSDQRSLTQDSLFTGLIGGCYFNNCTCKQKEYYLGIINCALKSLAL